MDTGTTAIARLVSGRRFMVTGAAGFIGSRLLSRLVECGAEHVVAVDRVPLGANPFTRVVDPSRVSEVPLSLGVCEAAELARSLDGVHAVFHLAAAKYHPHGEPTVEIVRSNVLGTAMLLDAARAARVSKVVFASSLYAYGRMKGEPFDESEHVRPCTVYGHSKWLGEEICRLQAGVASTALRYLFVYGPGQLPKHGYPSVVVKSFLRMLGGRRPVINGDGSQILDYVFVDDVVEATIRALRHEADGRTYNVGSGEGTSIRNLMAVMQDVAGFAGAPETGPSDQTAGTSRVARIDRIRDELGWIPTTSLRTGLDRTLESIRSHWEWYERERPGHVG